MIRPRQEPFGRWSIVPSVLPRFRPLAFSSALAGSADARIFGIVPSFLNSACLLRRSLVRPVLEQVRERRHTNSTTQRVDGLPVHPPRLLVVDVVNGRVREPRQTRDRL